MALRRSIREADIESHLVLELTRRGHLCLKLHTPGFSGIPDRLCLLQGGRIAFVELKSPGKKPEPHQARRIALLRSLGFTVEVIDTIPGVEQFVGAHA